MNDYKLVPVEPVGWQTIETAPKDGTTILVWFKQHGAMTVRWGDRDCDDTSEYAIWVVDDHKHGPYPVRGYSRGDDTHWMPLPDAPQSSAPPAALSVLPDSLPMEPYQTVDRGSPHYKAGWNACRRAMLAAQKEEISRALQYRDAYFEALMQAIEQVDALKAECEKLRKDAERYRWLREQCGNSGLLTIAKVGAFELKAWSGDDPDTAIDAAMAGGDQ